MSPLSGAADARVMPMAVCPTLYKYLKALIHIDFPIWMPINLASRHSFYVKKSKLFSLGGQSKWLVVLFTQYRVLSMWLGSPNNRIAGRLWFTIFGYTHSFYDDSMPLNRVNVDTSSWPSMMTQHLKNIISTFIGSESYIYCSLNQQAPRPAAFDPYIPCN